MHHTPLHLDHVSYACLAGEMVDVVQRIGSELGGTFVDGGLHPRFGTRNFVLPMTDGAYIEVVAALDHPAADNAPFGRAVRRRAEEGGGWLGWVVGVTDIEPIEARLGRPSVEGHRIRPDGVDLRWRQIGVLDLIDDPQMPFFVQWQTTEEHPSTLPGGDIALTSIELSGHADRIGTWLGTEPSRLVDCLAPIGITWATTDDHGLVSCMFNTPRGPVRVD
ncbi:MAG: VOC family protein [Actinomycetes bacterium]|jgi:hypothetical protein|nr:VOC family protein [Candidatus Nanopelagicales bacterium]